MPADKNAKIKKIDKGPLQRFKSQNAILKKFGENGLAVFRGANGKRNIQEITESLGLETDFVIEVSDWLVEKKIAEYLEGDAEEEPAGDEKPKKTEPRKAERGEKAPEKKIEIEEPAEMEEPIEIEKTPAPKKAEKPAKKEEKKEEEPEIDFDITPIEITPQFDSDEESAPQKEEGEVSKEKEGEISESEGDDKKEEKEIVFGGNEEKEGAEISKEKEGAEPESAGEKEAEKEEEGEKEVPEPEGDAEEEAEKEEDEPEGDEDKETEKPQDEIAPEESEELNPVEKTIKEKYGEAGLKVYALIDGQKTAEEIMKDVGISEAQLIEMLEYMEKQGIIKLEHPESKESAETKGEQDRFAPLEDKGGAEKSKDTFPVEIPQKQHGDMIGNLQLKAKIALRYGDMGSRVFALIDGINSTVDISVKTSIPIYELMKMLSFLIENRAITLKKMERQEITKIYGEDCLSIYKLYGREGVLLYELIGKDMGIRQMAKTVTEDNGRFVDMFIFIHKVLGIDIPIDKEVIFAQLDKKR